MNLVLFTSSYLLLLPLVAFCLENSPIQTPQRAQTSASCQPRNNCEHPSEGCPGPVCVSSFHRITSIVCLLLPSSALVLEIRALISCWFCCSCTSSTGNSSCSVNVYRMHLFSWLSFALLFLPLRRLSMNIGNDYPYLY